jgi:hypothetical protein
VSALHARIPGHQERIDPFDPRLNGDRAPALEHHDRARGTRRDPFDQLLVKLGQIERSAIAAAVLWRPDRNVFALVQIREADHHDRGFSRELFELRIARLVSRNRCELSARSQCAQALKRADRARRVDGAAASITEIGFAVGSGAELAHHHDVAEVSGRKRQRSALVLQEHDRLLRDLTCQRAVPGALDHARVAALPLELEAGFLSKNPPHGPVDHRERHAAV